MNSIIDASVATKWFLNEERSNAARMLLDDAALAFDIALTIRHPVYDCLYIACAEIEHATLITDDKKLFRAVQNTDYRNYVRLLDDPDLLAP